MSGLFQISWQDLFKGFVVGFFTGAIAFTIKILQNMVDTGVFLVTATQLYSVPAVGLIAGLGYLLKQFLTADNGKLGGRL